MKAKNITIFFLIILFISFISLYLVGNSSYYDYSASRKSSLTAEQIKEFETRIQNGEKIDIDGYLTDTEEDNNNLISSTSLKVSNNIGKTVDKIITFLFTKLDNAVKNK